MLKKREKGIHCQHIPFVRIKNTTTGITLIALVVTIVVLLILAGVTLTYVLGDNSMFNQALQAKIQTELGKIEERAQIIYSSKLLENASSTLGTQIETSEIIEQLRREEYIIRQRAVSAEDIKEISLDKENIRMGKNSTAELKVTYEGVEDPFIYYVEVQGKYYQMHSNKGFITIDREPSNLTKADFENEGNEEGSTAILTVTSSDETVATASLKAGSNNTIVIESKEQETQTDDVRITVTYGSCEPKTCKVKVKEWVSATSIEISSVRARIAKDYTRWLTAKVLPENADNKEVEWSSKDTEIATVDSKGVVTAKKAGTTTITVKTKDGSNLSKTCEVTIVENAPEVTTLTDFQTGNKVARDEKGNLITVPGNFKVLTSEGTKVTEGIVVQDREGNEFVWVPVDSVSTGTSKPAEDIRLGRYQFDLDASSYNGTSYTSGTGKERLVQDADNYTENISVALNEYAQYPIIEYSSNNPGNNVPAKNLGEFVEKTKANGGYYLARYEASYKNSTQCYSKKSTSVNEDSQLTLVKGRLWNRVTQPEAANIARNSFTGYVESDLVNSYAWDTAIVFIQRFSGNKSYSMNAGREKNTKLVNTGENNDVVCNIHDMSCNLIEWSTEYCDGITSEQLGKNECIERGGHFSGSTPNCAAGRRSESKVNNRNIQGFRVLLYIK